MRPGDGTFATLKAKHRDLRGGFAKDFDVRVHRAISWLDAAERASAHDDPDTAFICYWIAFNAAYSRRRDLHKQLGEKEFRDWYFEVIDALDRDRGVYNLIWIRLNQKIRIFIDNKYVFAPFWRFQHGESGFDDWSARFEDERRDIRKALGDEDTVRILDILFNRLYVLRNQLIHGGATWKGRVNRSQVRDGGGIMAMLVPQFIDLMMDNPDEEAWGRAPYPIIEPINP